MARDADAIMLESAAPLVSALDAAAEGSREEDDALSQLLDIAVAHAGLGHDTPSPEMMALSSASAAATHEAVELLQSLRKLNETKACKSAVHDCLERFEALCAMPLTSMRTSLPRKGEPSYTANSSRPADEQTMKIRLEWSTTASPH